MIEQDAARLLEYMDSNGIDGSTQVTRGWDHMGALVADAVLQRRQKYKATVYPRVQSLLEQWQDASTTAGLRKRLSGGGLSGVLRWRGQERLDQFEGIVSALETCNINTVEELASALNGERRDEVRSTLRRVKHVGPKTLDYIGILAGSSNESAVDSRIRAHMRSAKISDLSYAHVQSVMHRAADHRGWRCGDLDAALWNAVP